MPQRPAGCARRQGRPRRSASREERLATIEPAAVVRPSNVRITSARSALHTRPVSPPGCPHGSACRCPSRARRAPSSPPARSARGRPRQQTNVAQQPIRRRRIDRRREWQACCVGMSSSPMAMESLRDGSRPAIRSSFPRRSWSHHRGGGTSPKGSTEHRHRGGVRRELPGGVEAKEPCDAGEAARRRVVSRLATCA